MDLYYNDNHPYSKYLIFPHLMGKNPHPYIYHIVSSKKFLRTSSSPHKTLPNDKWANIFRLTDTSAPLLSYFHAIRIYKCNFFF